MQHSVILDLWQGKMETLMFNAGGLGNNARFDRKSLRNVAPEKILYYICAMRETFIAHGNYKQRGRARTRYMQETLGEEGYQAFMRN